MFNLRDEIIKEHSKVQCAKIVAWVGSSQQRFDELFTLFIEDEGRITQRAAWPISYCVSAYPGFIQKRFADFIGNLSRPGINDAVKRNTVRILQDVLIPEEYHGAVMNICFQFVESPTEAVAIKAFSLSILGSLARKYPEIIAEIKLLIHEQLHHQSAAFKSRARKVLKEL